MSRWIEQQQRRIQQLEAENLELRRQLDDLRRGVGFALIIEGRAIPLAELTPAVSVQPGDISSLRTQHVPSRPSALPAPGTPGASASMTPRPHHLRPQPVSMPPSEPAPFPEDAWLTDSGAVYISPTGYEHTESAPLCRPSASQEMTPTWLRENPPAHRSPQRAAERSREQHPAQPMARPIMRAQSRPDEGSIAPVPLRTLAQITGQQQASRQRATSDRPNQFSDSFVLG